MVLTKNQNGCPYLLLAPMEGVGDRTFRKAMATVGGFNEAVTDFIRVPTNAHIPSLAREYQADELNDIPLAAQLMGSDPELMSEMAQAMEKKGAPRIDLNCGCPSHRVTGRGAGSTLLKDPNFLHQVAKAMVKAVSIPVTVKMRSGYEDTSLFKENLLAAQESGIRFLTLHPRTKVDGYGPPARWDLIAEAKSILKIPLVGNGDILTVENAKEMLRQTKCDALMIGRGSVTNPFIFRQIQASFSGEVFKPKLEDLESYLREYTAQFSIEMPKKTQVNKLKQILSFVFKGSDSLMQVRNQMLTFTNPDPDAFLHHSLGLLQTNYI